MIQFINDFFLQKPELGVWAILSILISPCMDGQLLRNAPPKKTCRFYTDQFSAHC